MPIGNNLPQIPDATYRVTVHKFQRQGIVICNDAFSVSYDIIIKPIEIRGLK